MTLTTMRRLDYFVGIPACFLLSRVLTILERFRSPAPAQHPRKLLFIELSEMGSTILASPAIRRVQERYRDGEHCFAIFHKNAPSLRLLELFDERHIFTIRDDSLWHMAADMLRFMVFCRRERIDAVIDLELFSRVSSLLSMLSGARTRVGFHNYRAEGLYRGEHLTHRVHYNPYCHMSQNFIALTAALEGASTEVPQPKCVIPVESLPVRLGTDPDSFAYVREELARSFPLTSEHRIVVVNHDAGKILPVRSWPADRFVTLIRRLLAWDAKLVVVLMGIAEAKESAQAISEQVKDPRCIDFVGRTRTLMDLIQLFHQSELLITNDSGPAHFAVLTPVKSITLFGPETPVLYGPLGENAVHLYSHFACSPCLTALNNRNTPCTDNKCLQAISVEEVLGHAQRLLDHDPHRRPETPLAGAGDGRGSDHDG